MHIELPVYYFLACNNVKTQVAIEHDFVLGHRKLLEFVLGISVSVQDRTEE